MTKSKWFYFLFLTCCYKRIINWNEFTAYNVKCKSWRTLYNKNFLSLLCDDIDDDVVVFHDGFHRIAKPDHSKQSGCEVCSPLVDYADYDDNDDLTMTTMTIIIIMKMMMINMIMLRPAGLAHHVKPLSPGKPGWWAPWREDGMMVNNGDDYNDLVFPLFRHHGALYCVLLHLCWRWSSSWFLPES